MKKIGAPLVTGEFTLSCILRQKAVVLQLRGPTFFSRVAVRALPRLPGRPPRGLIIMGSRQLPCAIGRNGIAAKRREGDGLTPFGRLVNIRWLRRVDAWKVFRPDSYGISRTDGWCDDPTSLQYNRRVILPFRASAENLWRDDGLYDVIGVLDFNVRPRCLGRGSAIFFHLAHADLRPTAGCLALPRPVMRKAQSLWRAQLQIDVGDFFRPLRAPKMAEPTRT